nr:hypothetical protein [Tanacetum cinerariifolium]
MRIEAGLGEHLALMEHSNKIPIGDRGRFGRWFANRVDFQPKNVGNVGSAGRNAGRNVGSSGIHFDEEQNIFLLADIPEDVELQELNALCIMMAHTQIVANGSDAEQSYDSDFVNEVQDPSSSFHEQLFSNSDHEQSHYEQHETIKTTYDDDQSDSNIIFNDPDDGVNSDNVKQDNHAHD